MDVALCVDVMWSLRPTTVLEFGSGAGSSALWLADVLQTMGLSDSPLVSVDIKPVTEIGDPRIGFGYGEPNAIAETFPRERTRAFAKPFLVIDDASHRYQQILNGLHFFDQISVVGDFEIVEDCFVSPVGAEDLHDYNRGCFRR